MYHLDQSVLYVIEYSAKLILWIEVVTLFMVALFGWR